MKMWLLSLLLVTLVVAAPAKPNDENESAVQKAEEKANALSTDVLSYLNTVPGSHLSIAMRATLMLVVLFFVVQVRVSEEL